MEEEFLFQSAYKLNSTIRGYVDFRITGHQTSPEKIE